MGDRGGTYTKGDRGKVSQGKFLDEEDGEEKIKITWLSKNQEGKKKDEDDEDQKNEEKCSVERFSNWFTKFQLVDKRLGTRSGEEKIDDEEYTSLKEKLATAGIN